MIRAYVTVETINRDFIQEIRKTVRLNNDYLKLLILSNNEISINREQHEDGMFYDYINQ